MKIGSLISKYWDKIMEARRYLHMHPEPSNAEFETQKYIAGFLKEYGIEYTDTIYKTAVVALIRGKKPGRTLALRADMDALQMEEATGVDFQSVNKGFMHACGHDAHVTIMLGTILVLNELRDQLCGNVKVIFQPAEEEGLTGGAKGLIENGVLKDPDVDMILSTHVWPDAKLGTFGTCAGNMMASIDLVKVRFIGRGGHIGSPHHAISPVIAASQFLSTLSVIKSYYIDPSETVIWDLPAFQPSENVGNIIAGEVYLQGSVRAYSDELRDYIEAKCRDILEGFKLIYGVDYEYKYMRGYSATINDPEAADFLMQSARETLGDGNVYTSKPVMGSEDFGEFSKHVKGCFSNLGTREEGSEYYPVHHNKYIVPDKAIELGIKVFADAALKYLV